MPARVTAPRSAGPVVTNTNDSGAGSLRQAVATAASGQIITFNLSVPSTISLASPIAITKSVIVAGPGATKLAISGGGATRLFTILAKTSVTISGLTLTQGLATPDGGAVYSLGTLALTNDVFSSNFAGTFAAPPRTSPAIPALRFDPRPRTVGGRPSRPPSAPRGQRPNQAPAGLGGAVYNGFSLIVKGTSFVSNSVAQGSGGAIFSAAGTTLVVSNSTFDSNEAASGGAIDNAGLATLSNVTFTRNTGWPGGGAPTSGGYGYGAAVDDSGNLTLSACTFANNVAGGSSRSSFGYGGAIAQYGGTLAVTGSHFTANVAGGGTNGSYGYGGAIYDDSTGAVTLNGTTFSANRAGGDAFGYGGAVFVWAGLSAANDTFQNNQAMGSANSGYSFGGALYAGGALTLTSSTFSGNAALAGSSGYAFAGALDAEFSSKLTSDSFTNNRAAAGPAGSAEGAAIFANGGPAAWTTLTMTSNSATASGANSYAAGGAAVLFGSGSIGGKTSITSNRATSGPTGSLGGDGGGLAIEAGPFTYVGTIANNKASTRGGGLWTDARSTVINSTISGNQVSEVLDPHDGGGGVYNGLGGNLTIASSTLNGNVVAGAAALSGGGGLLNLGGLTARNATIAGNASSVDGGGVENAATTGVRLINVTIYQNTASNGNGGNVKNLYADAAMTLTTSIVAGGTAMAGADVSNDGTIVSGDYNLIQTAVAGGGSVSGTLTHNLQVDPLLGALGSNGGPTQTIADSSLSPGTGYIPYTICAGLGVTVDQRSFPRNNGNLCDIGAYELQP